jgi:hypothetical protein
MPRTTSTYADEGTLAHELAAAALALATGLIYQKDFDLTLNDAKHNPLYTPDMLQHAQDYSDYITTTLMTADCQNIRVEAARLPLDPWVPDARGTCDCIIDNGEELVIVDYKYGKGVKVVADNNPQLKLYALGALNSDHRYRDRIKTISLVIIQPRLQTGPPPAFVLSTAELLDWANATVQPAAIAAQSGAGEYAPDEDACRFCRGKAHCPGLAKEMFALAEELEETQAHTGTVDSLPIEDAEIYYSKGGLLISWLEALRERLYTHALQGRPLQRFKLVEGRSVRKIADPEAAAIKLRAAGFTDQQTHETHLLTLTKLEQLCGKKNLPVILDGVLMKSSSMPTLTPLSDPRPPIDPNQTILDAFDSKTKVTY